MKNKKLFMIIGLVVVAAGAAFLVYRDMHKVTPVQEDTVAETTDKTPDTSGAYTIAVGEPNPSAPKTPELVRSTDFKNTLSPEAKTAVLAHLDTIIKDLEKDSSSFENWIMLGVYRKNLGDYEGAREAWDYAKKLAPKEVVSYNNLADLYHYYLKDYPKSEENWKKTIELKADYVPGYSGLVDLYNYSLTSKKGEIPGVLKAGIAKNPDILDLMVMLARYYQDTGSLSEAKTAYSAAIATAERLGSTAQATALKNDLAALK